MGKGRRQGKAKTAKKESMIQLSRDVKHLKKITREEEPTLKYTAQRISQSCDYDSAPVGGTDIGLVGTQLNVIGAGAFWAQAQSYTYMAKYIDLDLSITNADTGQYVVRMIVVRDDQPLDTTSIGGISLLPFVYTASYSDCLLSAVPNTNATALISNYLAPFQYGKPRRFKVLHDERLKVNTFDGVNIPVKRHIKLHDHRETLVPTLAGTTVYPLSNLYLIYFLSNEPVVATPVINGTSTFWFTSI